MRPETRNFSEARGLWTGTEIIVKRSELSSVENYASTLLHEIAHVRSGETDITFGFEQELTSFLGMVASKALPRPSLDHELRQRSPNTQNSKNWAVSWRPAAESPASAKKTGFWAKLFGKSPK
jgi:hypothetical protein